MRAAFKADHVRVDFTLGSVFHPNIEHKTDKSICRVKVMCVTRLITRIISFGLAGAFLIQPYRILL